MGKPPPPTTAKSFFSREKFEVSPKLVINAVEGWGKTTLGAYAPDPVFIIAEGETGYYTLLKAGRVPDVPRCLTKTWEETLEASANTGAAKTVVLDAAGSFEMQLHSKICTEHFGGDKESFNKWGRGADRAVLEWQKMLSNLERSGATIILLCHSKIKSARDPFVENYDRYVPDLTKNTVAATHRWADAVLFGRFKSLVDTDTGRGIGGTDRVLYTENRDSHVAKNRFGMPPEIKMPDDPVLSYKAVDRYISKGGGE